MTAPRMRIHLSYLYQVALLVSIPQCVAQAPAAKLTLADCIRLADSVPSAVSVARQEARIAALGVTVARSALLPGAGFTGGATFNSTGPNGSRYVALNGSREYISTANIGMEIDTSGRLRAAYARSKVDQQIAEAGTGITVRDLHRAVTISYYRLLVSRKVMDAAELSLVEARSFEDRTRKLFAGGEVAQADVVKASAQVASFDQTRRAAELDARLANQDLASFWTSDVDNPLELEDVLAQPPAAPIAAATSYLKRPEFRIFDLQSQGFLLDAKRARAALYPQVSLNYQYGVDANQYRWSERGAAAFLTVNVPIFDWFKARSLAQQFTLKAEQTSNTRKVTERAFSREYENARTRAASLYEQITLAQSQVLLFQENLKLSQIRYEGGEGPALDVVVAQTQLQQARTNYFTTLLQYASASADLEVARGQ